MAIISMSKNQFRKFNAKRNGGTTFNKKMDERNENRILDKTNYDKEFKFWVSYERLVTKPRMTQSDKWNHRPEVDKYWKFKDEVIRSYKRQGGKIYNQPIALTFIFKLKPDYKRRDLDNLIKGLKDALIGVAFPDDCIRIIRKYDIVEVFFNKDKEESEAVKIIIRPLPQNGNIKIEHEIDELKIEEEEINYNR